MSIRNLTEVKEAVTLYESVVGKLNQEEGIRLVLEVQEAYKEYKERPCQALENKYLKLRVGIHLKWGSDEELLSELDRLYNLGLRDSDVGETYWGNKDLDKAMKFFQRDELRKGRLQAKAGVGLTLAIQDAYERWLLKPTKGNRTKYLRLRLALHLNWNSEKEFLRELNDLCGLGLNDENVGETLWEIEPRVKGIIKHRLHKSGEGLKGASSPGSQITLTTQAPDGK